VTVQGVVADTSGNAIPGAQVLYLPPDPYLEKISSTQTGASGSFTLGGLAPNALDGLAVQATGYASEYVSVFATSAPKQTMGAVAMMTNDQAAAIAATFGVQVDSSQSVVRVPVLIADGAAFQVSFYPLPGAQVQYGAGEAIAINAWPNDAYRVTVMSPGRKCAPAWAPQGMAPDGSITVAALGGFWTTAPAFACE